MGGEPRDVVRPDDDDAATGPADPLHLRQAGLAAMARSGRERRARDDQVGVVVGHGQVVEEAMGHPDAMPMVRVARAFDSGSRAAAQRVRSPTTSRARSTSSSVNRPVPAADLDDPLDVVRQPPEHARMEPLGADEPVIELRLEPVQELPGQGDVESAGRRPRPGTNRLASSSVSTPRSAVV